LPRQSFATVGFQVTAIATVLPRTRPHHQFPVQTATTASAEGHPRMASDAGTLGNLHRAIFRQLAKGLRASLVRTKLPPGRGRDNVRASSFGVALIAVSVAGIILGLVAVARIW